ncbi:short-chain dehydrogenase TIC 32, chloroplastic-like isoform X2 [Rosa rugosa]|uniref:short-chain dehydrogenase TIC 32, chloroplastic-like isoform X2 n=1 Tax=Rosa rugosa TaxID=74645 RepID=UPI002B416422|nr:short-chain dehydrogenase TIC 32, chloroplastic-like isoform X2 [Rosa rugosa]
MAVRNVDAGTNVKEAILKGISNAKIDVMELDLSSMASVRKFAEEYNSKGLPLNILINNAGVMVDKFKLSQDNIELDFATNHLGHFHPGTIRTNIMRNDIHVKCLLKVLRIIFMSKTIQQGAATTCFLGLKY